MTNPPSGQNRESRGNRGSGDGKSNEKGENKSNGRTGRGGPGRSGGESDKEPGDSTDSDLPQDGTSQGERTKGGRNKSDKRKGERTHDGETQPRQHDESEEFDDGRPSKPARGSSTHSGQSWPGEGEQSDGASVRPGSGNAANSVEDDGDHRKSSLNHGSSPRKKNDGSSLKMNLIGTLEQLVWTYFLYRCIVAGILG
ncbi:hypothetical protein BT63DRAFT_430022 [Microthyrium microscopicum]|uniref:Uncharacterized protein n=1 Tax=Microthyrium microscopicum TaxID=703497 RepID=A0A6A6TW98_9PEZI|nr:hypothetical protein BT63DRAFT_430022 [Microthyrium microscopicum]